MPATKRARVVVVDDDPDVSDSLKAVVTALGHDCDTFQSAEEFLLHGDLTECGCLLVDYNLPGMSGTELLTRVYQAASHPPAALYTGQIGPHVRSAAALLKNTPVIEKGDGITTIVAYLESVLPAR